MTTFPTEPAVESPLEQLLNALDETAIQQTIDNPIDRAVETLECAIPDEVAYTVFNRIIAQCVRHIYEKGLTLPRTLSLGQALGEAVVLLESSYHTPDNHGYDGAFVDARRIPPDGLQIVLSELIRIIKSNERQKYMRWISARWVQGVDWTNRCRLTQEFMDRYRDYFSSDLQNCSAEQLADDLPDLVHRCLATPPYFNQFSVMNPFSFER